MNLLSRRLSIAAVLGMVTAGVATAQPIQVYSANFDTPTYGTGALIGQDGWLITGTSTLNPITVNAGSVPLATTGQDVNRPFALIPATTAAFLAADVNITAAQATGDYFMHLGDGGGSNFFARVYVRSVSGGIQFALTTSSGTVPATAWGATLPLGSYRVVAQYNIVSGLTNDTGSLFINPTNAWGVGDTAYSTAATIGADAVTISSVNLRQGNSANAATVVVDNIAVAYIPTPGSAALLGIGLAASARRRR